MSSGKSWSKWPKKDLRKCVLAWLVHTESMVSHKWIGQRLHLGHPSQISVHIARVRTSDDRVILHLRRQLESVTQDKKD